MCGIAGIISRRGVSVPDLKAMSAAIRHRGPNGHGFALASPAETRIWLDSEPADEEGQRTVAAFAHRRLSILDLSPASAQPMAARRGRLALTYNGELYNYQELRGQLGKLGHRFATTGDTEVVLRAYDAWGPACVERFNGMWAFALVDLDARHVFISRDRFGIKPLFYTVAGETLYFASEIKGLLAVPAVSRRPNLRVVARFLERGLLDVDEESFYEDIRRLPAAHSALVPFADGVPLVAPFRYWDFPTERFAGDEREAIDHFRELFLDAVRVHTASDVPVGTCLSGGLDSSSIVCAAEQLRNQGAVPAYSHSAYGYCAADQSVSERAHMQRVVQATGVDMHFIECSEDRFLDCVPEIVRSQDEPFGSASIVAQWRVFERARATGISVMLDGQGADEVLGGYHHFLPRLGSQLLHQREIRAYLRLRREHNRDLGPFPVGWGTFAQSVLPALVFAALAAARGAIAGRGPIAAVGTVPTLSTQALFAALPDDSFGSPMDTLDDTLKRYVTSLCMPALLRYEDRNSMAHSLEARVPFLDHRLVEFAFTLPWQLKINGAVTKYILREAMTGILPEPVRTRHDKIGFQATPRLTFDFARQNLDDLLAVRTDEEDCWISSTAAKRLLTTDDRSGATEFQLWRLINLKLWLRNAAGLSISGGSE